jgi:hypothetical protein
VKLIARIRQIFDGKALWIAQPNGLWAFYIAKILILLNKITWYYYCLNKKTSRKT